MSCEGFERSVGGGCVHAAVQTRMQVLRQCSLLRLGLELSLSLVHLQGMKGHKLRVSPRTHMITRTTHAGMSPYSHQAQYVRYQGSVQNTEGCWRASDSAAAAARGVMKGQHQGVHQHLDFIKQEIVSAPAEWAVPVKQDK